MKTVKLVGIVLSCDCNVKLYVPMCCVAVKELLERMNGSVHYTAGHRESLTLPPPPPPIPQRETRPRSAGYTMASNTDTLARTPTRGGADYSSLPVMRTSRQVIYNSPLGLSTNINIRKPGEVIILVGAN